MSAAEEAAQLISQEDCWELVSPPSLAILCFRFRAPELDQPDEDRLQDAIARASAEHGCCFLSTTALSGRPVLRMCTIQPTTTSDDLRETLECLRKHGERLRLTC